VASQIPSLLASVMGRQLPHQLLKVPLTSGIPYPDMPFISTLNVTVKAKEENENRKSAAAARNDFIGSLVSIGEPASGFQLELKTNRLVRQEAGNGFL